MVEFRDVPSGDWVVIDPDEVTLMRCCDCKLVHTLEFGIARNSRLIMLRMIRSETETSEQRKPKRRKP